MASADERSYMAVEVANYIHDVHNRAFHAGSFEGATAVEIGAAVIEQPGALADWRSETGMGAARWRFSTCATTGTS